MNAAANATADGRLGFVAEPNDTVRGTMSILYTCLFTLYLCTWSALHLSIPLHRLSQRQILVRKLKWVLVATMAPELIALHALTEYVRATEILAGSDWPFGERTRTHAFYIIMRGLRLRLADDGSQVVLSDMAPDGMIAHPKPLKLAIREGLVKDLPLQMSEDTIRDKSKASWLTKSFLFGQLGYFLMQLIGRWPQQLAVTPLELLTLGIAVSITVAYAAWWDKPFDVEVPTEVPVDQSKVSFGLIDDFQLPLEHRQNMSIAQPAWKRAMDTYLQDLPEAMRVGVKNRASRAANRFDVCGFPTIMTGEPVTNLLGGCNSQHVPAQDLEHWKTYAQKVSMLINLRHAQRWQTKSLDTYPIPEPSAPLIGFVLTSLLFGSCHLIGWNFDFPTAIEVLLWRVASVLCIATSVLTLVVVLLSVSVHPESDVYSILDTLLAVLAVAYVIARFYLLVAVSITFRSMPVGAFTRVDWTLYIPHIG